MRDMTFARNSLLRHRRRADRDPFGRRIGTTRGLDQQMRALDHQMRVGFVAEADAAVDLDIGAGIGERGVDREQQSGLDLEGGIAPTLVERDRGEGDLVGRGAGDHRHVGAAMLDRLEAADRMAELFAHAGVSDRHITRAGGDPAQRGGLDQPDAQHRLDRRPADIGGTLPASIGAVQ
jgi:hypothetical protein